MPRPKPKRRPQQSSAQDFHVPAPIGGLNNLVPPTAMPEENALLLYNMLAAEGGLRVRSGWREWVTGLTGITNNEVRTMLPFMGSAANGALNKLFAATEDGLFDATDSTTAPTKVLDLPSKTIDSGVGVPLVMVTAAGHFLLYADEENGYCVYSETSLAWSKIAYGTAAGQVSGVDPANICAIFVWQNRVWFIEKNSARAWYLDPFAIYGVAKVWNFGTKFGAGGHLVGLYSYTGDGGAGMDDSMVAISGGGDIVIYQGTDPDTAGLFLQRGVWNVGAMPKGRRVATKNGGDLLLLTSLGVLPVSRLLNGASVNDPKSYLTEQIAPLFTLLVSTARSYRGWAMMVDPLSNALLITIPTPAPDASGNKQPTTQLVYSFAAKSWSQYGPGPAGTTASRALPIYSGESYDGKLYFGTVDGRVCIHEGYVDGVLLSDVNAYTDIDYALLTGCNNLGNPKQKMIDLIRPMFLSGADAPAFRAEAKYNLDQSEVAVPTAGTPGANSFDTGVWDSAVWGADQQAVARVMGAAGMGSNVAIAVRGKARSRTILVGFDVVFRVSASFL